MMERREFIQNVALVAGGVALSSSLLEAAPTKKANPKPIIVIHGGTSGLGLTQEEFEQRKSYGRISKSWAKNPSWRRKCY